MYTLPRAARFASWTNAWLAGTTSLDDAGEAIRADDTAHHLIDLPGQSEPLPLVLGLGALRNLGTRAVALALPAPGDPLGLAGPREFTELAVDTGEAVVCEGSALGLVPHVAGAGVQWQVYRANPPVPVAFAETALELAHTLQEVIDALAGLDVARWRPGVAEALIDLRAVGGGASDGLPPGYSARAEELAARARRCLLVCDLALTDDGGATTLFEAESRRRALRHLESASRRALVAACAPPR
ncbi:hypothetical protein [Actinopolymorpha alba]|uniref:hypothetical protein n=1 Tax=Actinopolymorpha alba TaxID=533267 RepID=UPI000376D705|nr:hypothetical protein [Actinopolymorpha alba]